MYDVVIIGAGAAGLMAAGVAARSGSSVLVVEKMEKAARKVRITGKGRCNLTNIKPQDEFLEKVKTNADFFAPAFAAFDNDKVVGFFRHEGVPLTVERGGRVFPESGKAWDIADALVDWARDGGAELMMDTTVDGILTVGSRVRGVKIVTKRGFPRNVECSNVIVCTGGVSYPSTGSTGDGYRFAHELGHRIEEVRPSLVPLESDSPLASQLVGIRLRNAGVRLLVDGEATVDEFGEMEFSSRGLEGPTILRISRQAVDALIEERHVEIDLDLKPALSPEVLTARIDREIEELTGDAPFGELMRKLLPKAMGGPFAELFGIDLEMPLCRLTDTQKEVIVMRLKSIRLHVSDYRPFEEAVVTAGGVDVAQVDPQTMQSRLVSGLYFAGEVLDIDADTGGYNLQVAFSTGHLAGKLKK